MVGQLLLGRYEVIQVLGEGGMGRVLLARQQSDGQEVVLKLVHPRYADDPKFRTLFLREMEFMSRFRHPHVVRFFEAAVDGPQGPCIVMEYITGLALDQMLKRHGRFGPSRVGKWLGQIGSALQFAHKMSLIHRDLKPSNLMLEHPDTAEEKIKIMDFGLSRFASVPQLDLEELRGRGKRVSGTPEYFSPEQARGDDLDPRSDLYAVGVVLFELLAGRKPFIERNARDFMRAHAYDKPPSFAKVGITDVPPAIESVVQRCLFKYAAERPYDANELVQLFEKALGEKIAVHYEDETADDMATTPGPVPPKLNAEPGVVVHTLEAWMPEKIAVVKLQGFMEGAGGKVISSQPGVVRMRMRFPQANEAKQRIGFFASLFQGKPPPPPPPKYVFLDIYMEKRDPAQTSRLTLTLALRADNVDLTDSKEGQVFCTKVCSDICAYLMAKHI